MLPTLQDLQAELTRRGLQPLPGPDESYRSDPVGWITSRVGEHAWSVQREIANALVRHRKVAVQSCNSSGKSWLAGRLAAWFIAVHPPGKARVVTSAPTGAQVTGVLWQEIRAAAHKAGLPGRLNQKDWWQDTPAGEQQVAIGRKTNDLNMAAFQGFHAPYMLVVFDEADGMSRPLWRAAQSLLASGEGYWLAIGNPYDPTSEFAEVCKPGSGWYVVKIPAWKTPNFTGEAVPEAVNRALINQHAVEDYRRRIGEGSSLWKTFIEAEFPEQAEDTLIPVSWIRRAQEATDVAPIGPKEMGVDVGGGGDKTVIVLRQGPVAMTLLDEQEPDTMVCAAKVAAAYQEHRPDVVKVDQIGIGAGVVDRLREIGIPVKGINVARRALDPKQFANLRAEGFWTLRQLFQDGQIAIPSDDDELAAQLVNIKWKRRVNGIQIEPKDQMRARGLPSPDRADALMLSYIVPHQDFGLDHFASLQDW